MESENTERIADFRNSLIMNSLLLGYSLGFHFTLNHRTRRENPTNNENEEETMNHSEDSSEDIF